MDRAPDIRILQGPPHPELGIAMGCAPVATLHREDARSFAFVPGPPSSSSCRNARRGGGFVGHWQRKGGASGSSSYWKRPGSRCAVDPELLEQILSPEPVFAEVRRFGVDRHDRY